MLQTLLDRPVHSELSLLPVVLDHTTYGVRYLLALKGEGSSPSLGKELIIGLHDATVEGLLAYFGCDILGYGEANL